jgi:ClpP class serine protease
MFSPSRPFDEAELDWLRDEIQAVYDKFVSRVVEGRGMAPDAVDRYGRGRVWTGRQALERGLVDSLGGWPEALALARDRAGLPLEKATSVSPTRPRSGGLLDPRRRLNSHIASIVDPQWLEAAWLGGPQGPRVAVWAPLPRV